MCPPVSRLPPVDLRDTKILANARRGVSIDIRTTSAHGPVSINSAFLRVDLGSERERTPISPVYKDAYGFYSYLLG